MILKLLQVIKEADDLIKKVKTERGLIAEIYQDLTSIDLKIESTIDLKIHHKHPKRTS